MAIDTYANLVTSQHKTKPKFTGTLNMILTYADVDPILNSWDASFDIDKATGSQLDIIGQIVGLSRVLPFQPSDSSGPTMNDYVYTLALKAKIVANQWDGHVSTINAIWQSIFTNIGLVLLDNQDMSFTAVVLSIDQLIIRDLVQHGMLIPKPEGVQFVAQYGQYPIFGYDLQTAYIQGYNTGNWIYTTPLPAFVYGTPSGSQGGYGSGYWE